MQLIARRFVFLVLLFGLGALVPLAWSADKTQAKALDDYNFAVWLYNGGKYDLAAEAYAAFLKNYPDHERRFDARFGLAQSLFHVDKFGPAAGEYEQVRAGKPDFPQAAEVCFQLGQSYVALGRFADAIPLFAQMRDKHAGHYLADWAVARQAACQVSLEKYKEAEELLKPFVGKYPDPGAADTKAMLKRLDEAGVKAGEAFLGLIERSAFHLAFAQFSQNRFGDAQKSFELFLGKYPGSDLAEEARFRLAQSLYRQEAYARAAAAYEKVADGSGAFAEPASYERGLALYKAGSLKEASVAFAKMAERFPQGAQAGKARLYAGTALFEAGEFAMAIERLAPLSKEGKEQSAEAAYWVAMSLLKQGKAEDAEKALQSALRDFPKSTVAGDMQLGLADACLARDKFGEAAAAFLAYAAAFESTAQAPRALYSACAALHRADKFAESEAQCRRFIDKFSANELAAQVLFLSGENRFLLKQYPEAGERYQAFLKQAGQAEDRVARANYRLAWVHHYAKRNKEALELLAKVDRKAAGAAIAAEADYLAGICRFEMEEYPAAVQSLRAYLDAPDHARFGDDALLKAAMALMKQGQKAEAARYLERFLREYPQSDLMPQVQYQVAECHFDQKAFDKAADAYAKVVSQATNSTLAPYALFGMGMCHVERGQWAEAVQVFDRVVNQYPASEVAAQAHYRKAWSLIRLGQWAEAEQAAMKVYAAFPRHELARVALMAVGTCRQEQKKWDEAAAAFKTLAEEYPKAEDLARVLYEQAWSWRQAGKDENSLAAFRALAEKCPADPLAADACFYLGEARYKIAPDAAEAEKPEQRSRRLREALALYAKALELSKDKRLGDKVLFRMGWSHWLMDEYGKAAEFFDRMTAEFPDSDLFMDALLQAGQAHARDGRTEEAIARFRRFTADRRAAGHELLPDACLGLANCLIILDKHADAVEPLETLLKSNPDDSVLVQANFLLGKARFNLRKYDAAESCFQEVTKRTKSETGAEAQFFLGQVAQARNDFKGAVMAYLRVSALYSAYPEWVAGALFESGKCQEALGDKAEAVKAYDEILRNYKGTKWAKPAGDRRGKL